MIFFNFFWGDPSLVVEKDKSNSVSGVIKVLPNGLECNSMIDNEIDSNSISTSGPISMDNDATVSLYGINDNSNLANFCETQTPVIHVQMKIHLRLLLGMNLKEFICP